MRKDLFNIARLFKHDRVWLQIIAIFGSIGKVEGLLYEAEQKAERR